MAILGAVLYGCAFLVPAVGAAATITVEIIKPVDDQVVFDVGKEYDFEAVAFIEGVELPGGEVTWDWDFGDGSAHSADNPAKHKFMACGKYRVTVTATYGGASQPLAGNSAGPRGTVATQALTGQDTLDTVIGVPGSEGLAAAFQWEARNGGWNGPKFGGEVSDDVCVVLRVSSKALEAAGAIWGVPRFWRTVHGVPIEQYGMVQCFQYEVIGDELWTIAYCNWTTSGDKNGEAVEWTAEVSLEVPPPPGGEAPYTQILPIKGKSWTPNNLVIDSGEPLVIEHHPGETKHTLSWSSTHLEDDAAGVGKIYSALVQIFNLSGGDPIAQETVTRELNKAATYDWSPNLGMPESPDTYGLYTFKITGEHGAPCADTDKADLISNVHSVVPLTIDWDTLKLKGKIGYTAAFPLDSPKLEIKGPKTLELDLPTEAGYHEVEYELDIGYGAFWAVITATETAERAANNRDGKAKPVLPKGCYLDTIPGPPASVEIYEPAPPPDSNFNLSFNTAAPGVCKVRARGRVKDAEGNILGMLNGGLIWAPFSVGSSILTTLPASARGEAIELRFERLPENNSDFGAKTLTLSHPLVASSTSKTFKIFFPADGLNHPGQNPNPVAWTPNWYYYWRQGVVTDLTHFTYDRFVATGLYDPATGFLKVGDGAAGANSPTWKATNSDTGEQWQVGGDGVGVDCCAEVCAHELKHKENDLNNIGVDSDEDGLSDDYELAAGYNLNPNKRDTYGMGQQFKDKPNYTRFGDDEFLAHRAEFSPGPVDASADWSASGKNGRANVLE
ncbi:MAG: PKD domain-containing protein [Armatimonadia bacterium]